MKEVKNYMVKLNHKLYGERCILVTVVKDENINVVKRFARSILRKHLKNEGIQTLNKRVEPEFEIIEIKELLK